MVKVAKAFDMVTDMLNQLALTLQRGKKVEKEKVAE